MESKTNTLEIGDTLCIVFSDISEKEIEIGGEG
jgi:hypothetical protein